MLPHKAAEGNMMAFWMYNFSGFLTRKVHSLFAVWASKRARIVSLSRDRQPQDIFALKKSRDQVAIVCNFNCIYWSYNSIWFVLFYTLYLPDSIDRFCHHNFKNKIHSLNKLYFTKSSHGDTVSPVNRKARQYM